jgi:hypothetical protein
MPSTLQTDPLGFFTTRGVLMIRLTTLAIRRIFPECQMLECATITGCARGRSAWPDAPRS